jgi:hypothetical protein
MSTVCVPLVHKDNCLVRVQFLPTQSAGLSSKGNIRCFTQRNHSPNQAIGQLRTHGYVTYGQL